MTGNQTHAKKGKSNIIIWQQNINKSRTCQHDLISSGKLIEKGVDVVALQEPSINTFNKTIASKDWKAIYPSTHESSPHETRTLLLVRDSILTDSWEQLEVQTGDVTAIRIKGEWGKITIFNIYNDCEHNNTIVKLTKYHRTHNEELMGTLETQDRHHVLWVGDFNRHHPYWDAPENNGLFTRGALEQAEMLIQTLAEFGLEMALAAGTPTHEHYVTKRWSRLDQVFTTEHTLEAIEHCEALPEEQGINTDHFPIVTSLNLSLALAPKKEIRNYREVEWETFRDKLKSKISGWGIPKFIKTQSELNKICTELTSAIQETIEEEVPKAKIGPHAKRWWTKELTGLRQDMLKTQRRACKLRGDANNPLWEKFKDLRRAFNKELDKAKRDHWRDWLEKSTDPDLWTAHKYIAATPGDSGRTRIPDLTQRNEGTHTVANTNEGKGKMLAKAFFLCKPVEEETTQIHSKVKPICKSDPISKEQIRRALARLKPYKAPGPDGIPNVVLMKCADLLIDRLWHIYAAIWDRGLYYAPWRESITIVLRKPGKPRYDSPKAYRPIALLNTLGKVLTAIAAEQLTYYMDKYELLPALHFGGRPARTTGDALHFLIHRIKDAWRKKQVVSVLFLDIEGAFPNAVNKKLLENLERRRVPTKIVQFVGNMLNGRATCLKFDDHESENISLDNGIGQGDPLSMVLYQYYNADLLDIPKSPSEMAAAYVDDAILVATAPTFEGAHAILEDMMIREGGAMKWARQHNSKFEMSKLALLNFSHRSKAIESPPLTIADTIINASSSVKYLGIYLDQHLNWKEQVAYAMKKGTKWAAQIKRVVRPGWGLSPKNARRLYTSVALPRILYGVDVWAPPDKKKEGSKTGGIGPAISKLTSVQRPGALAIVRGLRTSPSDSLCAHANILPIHLEIDKICGRAALWLATLPEQHPLTKLAKRSAKGKIKRHKLPIHHLMTSYGTDPESFETIPVAKRNPARIGKQPFTTIIPESKEASKEADAQAPQHIKIYTDSSAQEGKVGAAAILTKDGKEILKAHYHLGKTEDHTVFEAELVGLLLGLKLIEKYSEGNITYLIGVDNQAAIKALASKLNKPGHYLAAEVLREAEKLRKAAGKKYALTIRWTAGHSGIKGNEDVDTEAKKAAEGHTTAIMDLPKILKKTLKKSKSAGGQRQQEIIKERWRKDWTSSPRYERTKRIDSSLPSCKFIELISNKKVHRETASKIYQIRSGHVPLNAYLHRFKIKESAQCPACGAPNEMPQHFILECPVYRHERWKLRPKKGKPELKYEDLLSNKEKTVELAHYILDTRRFGQIEPEGSTRSKVTQCKSRTRSNSPRWD